MLFYIITFFITTDARNWGLEWEKFKLDFNKSYDSAEQEKQRFEVFVDNTMLLESWNMGKDREIFGITEFADVTYNEFASLKCGYSAEGLFGLPKWDSTCYTCKRFPQNDSLPQSIDWVTRGALNPVRNQKRCGSCWAFSTISGAEAAIFIGSGYLPQLSEEELVQCAHSAGRGCLGGEMQAAYSWILNSQNGFVDNRIDYPYSSGNGQTGKCQKGALKHDRGRLSGAVSINYFENVDEDLMREAVAKVGPLSVGINARYLHHYKGGILDPEVCTSSLNHGVVIVGYGIENNTPYWKIRNSWSSSWGESGYFRIKRGESKCGIAQDVSAAYFFGRENTRLLMQN